MTDEDINLQDIDELEGEPQLYEHFRFVVDSGQEPLRIDKYMLEKLQHSSRNRIQRAADAGFVHVNDRPVKRNYRVRPGDVVTLMLDRPRHDTSIEAEDIPLDVVYEDSQLMVVNKPAGLVVHPGVGNFTGTLVNALAWHLRDVEGYDVHAAACLWLMLAFGLRFKESLMLRPHVDLLWDFGPLRAGVSWAKVYFPNGDIDSDQVGFILFFLLPGLQRVQCTRTERAKRMNIQLLPVLAR